MVSFQLIGSLRRTEVGWAGKNVAKMLAVHEISAGFFDVRLELVEAIDPSSPAGLHIAVLLHRNHSKVVFFVDPDLWRKLKRWQLILIFRFRKFQQKSAYQEVLLVVVPDASGIGPVSGHTGGGKKRRNGLVEEEVVSDQLLLGGVGHFVKREVLAYAKKFIIFSRIKLTLKIAIESI